MDDENVGSSPITRSTRIQSNMSLIRDTCRAYNDQGMSNIFVDNNGVERYKRFDYRSCYLAMACVKQRIKDLLLSEAERLGIREARVSFYNMDFTSLFGLDCVIILSNSLGGLKKNAMLNKITFRVSAVTERSDVSCRVSAKTDDTFTAGQARQLADSLSKLINE